MSNRPIIDSSVYIDVSLKPDITIICILPHKISIKRNSGQSPESPKIIDVKFCSNESLSFFNGCFSAIVFK